MWLLLLCILINTLIGIIFKLFGKWEVNVLIAIIINYFTCVVTGSLVYGRSTVNIDIVSEAWFPYAAFLGLVFVSIFTLVALTVRSFGIMIATIFQKMSLIFPAIMGMLFYAESSTSFKVTGILLSVLAIVLISFPSGKKEWNKALIWLPLATWLGSGIIEVTLFYVNIEGIAPSADIRFISSIFLFAACFGMILFIISSFRNKAIIIRGKDILAGILLGIPNFFSIYLLLVLLDNGWPGSELFPINNVGILFFSSLIGVAIFAERLNALKLIGFLASIIAIVLIANG
jgi:drug/metabolite transporter (DMT)-like permease